MKLMQLMKLQLVKLVNQFLVHWGSCCIKEAIGHCAHRLCISWHSGSLPDLGNFLGSKWRLAVIHWHRSHLHKCRAVSQAVRHVVPKIANNYFQDGAVGMWTMGVLG